MKVIFLVALLFSVGFAVDPFTPFTSKGINYAIKDTTCRSCIDKIGKGEFSSICYGADEKSIYCCNSAPPDPPLSNSP